MGVVDFLYGGGLSAEGLAAGQWVSLRGRIKRGGGCGAVSFSKGEG